MIFKENMKHFFEVLGPVSITAKNEGSISNRICTKPSEEIAQFSILVREFCMDRDKITKKRS